MITAITALPDTSDDIPFHDDPWKDWKPQFTLERKSTLRKNQDDIHTRQEKIMPSEKITLCRKEQKTPDEVHRRVTDARLWGSMSAAEQRAALIIAFSFESMGRGLGYVTSNWARIPGTHSGNPADSHARLVGMYVDWTKACHREKISHSMIIDVLVFGFTCTALDRDRRVRSGSTRQNLLDGLRLYCRLCGWDNRC